VNGVLDVGESAIEAFETSLDEIELGTRSRQKREARIDQLTA
jgi:hypothetical protein